MFREVVTPLQQEARERQQAEQLHYQKVYEAVVKVVDQLPCDQGGQGASLGEVITKVLERLHHDYPHAQEVSEDYALSVLNTLASQGYILRTIGSGMYRIVRSESEG